MILCAVIGISLVSYIKLATGSLALAERSFHEVSALNLAERGLQEAVHCYNRLATAASPEEAWTISGVSWTRGSGTGIQATIGPVTLGGGARGLVRVYCSDYNPSANSPEVVAKATITMPHGPPLEKWLHVQLQKRSLWALGMVGRRSIVWNGGSAAADSWASDPDGNSATPPVAYDSSAARANASIAVPSEVNGALDIGGGAVRGRILTGGGAVFRTSSAILSDTVAGTGWNENLTSGDFNARFTAVVVPEPPTADRTLVTTAAPITFPSSLPRAGDRAWNGAYYYEFAAGYTLGSSGDSSKVIVVDGPVVFLATANSGANTIDLGGNAGVRVTSRGSLAIYTNGNIEAGGNSITSAGTSPAAVQIYGTHPDAGAQTIRFVGNTDVAAAIYAPNATFQLRGNGSLRGAVVANSIHLNGNTRFHFDEALGRTLSWTTFGMTQWRELPTPDDRAPYSERLRF